MIEISDYEPIKGDKVYVTGWGTTKDHPDEISQYLMGVELEVFDLTECQSMYGEGYNLVIKPSMFCAGELALSHFIFYLTTENNRLLILK